MLRRRRRARLLRIGLVAVLITGTVVAVVTLRDRSSRPELRIEPVARACTLDKDILTRLWRGHDRTASEDITLVPREPNYVGTFDLVSHSGPWDYLQRIPLVFYGPRHIAAGGKPLRKPANIVDVYATVDELLDVDLPERDGRPLKDALIGSSRPPKLVVVVVWDGAGRATLERWPDRWPTLARLERSGTSYLNATVGTSPSVTSAVHSSLGTGAWPRNHRVTGNDLRKSDGSLLEAFADGSADALDLTTFADEADRAYGNDSRVGLLGWTPWHVGMLGHGRGVARADRDDVALIRYRDGAARIGGDAGDFSVRRELTERASIDDHIEELDRSDGGVDGTFLGHDITPEGQVTWLTYWNPAWTAFQEELLEKMIDRGGYGRDLIPDFLLVNFKMTDLAGHRWALDSEETATALGAQDSALNDLIAHLDATVGDYVVVVTADHGHSASPSSTGAWPISQERLKRDLDRYFGVTGSESLIESTSAFGLYLSEDALRDAGASPEEVAEFLGGYTIRDNWDDEELPNGYRRRGDEQIFSAVFAKSQFSDVMRCAFGAPAPPRDARA